MTDFEKLMQALREREREYQEARAKADVAGYEATRTFDALNEVRGKIVAASMDLQEQNVLTTEWVAP